MNEKKERLSPLLKYPGGKEKELPEILPSIPKDAVNYYEPFVGGGAVYFAIDADKYFINDKSEELMNLYEMISTQNTEFFSKIERMNYDWGLMSDVVVNHYDTLVDMYINYRDDKVTTIQLNDKIIKFVWQYADDFNGLLLPDFNMDIQNFVEEVIKSLKNKFFRMKKLEQKKGILSVDDLKSNCEGAFKAAFYTHFRYLYNNIERLKIKKPFATAIYFFIREYCYSSMFRYNANGKFNVPYGGISYNKKMMTKKIEYFKSEQPINHLKKTIMNCLDFTDFMKQNKPNEKDFVFLDPPYDTEFSTYAQNEFGKDDQIRLSEYLKNECMGYFMMVIKDTDFIRNLYPNGLKVKNDRNLRVRSFAKQYLVSFQDRNAKNVEHLVITNY